MAVDAALVAKLVAELDADLQTDARLGKVRRYLKGDHDLPYMPKSAKKEYVRLAERARTNWLPLISDTYAKGLFVDGYRPARSADNAKPWEWWQANGLDSRQSIAHRGALEHGAAYTLVLPGTVQTARVPVIRPLSPLRSLAWYADPDDDYPDVGLLDKGKTLDGTRLVQVIDREAVHTWAKPPKDDAAWVLSKSETHGLGYTPLVRFRDRIDGEATGIIRPVLTLQDRVNEIVFNVMIALQYASFRQRWATGLAIPEDEDGNPVEPFQSAVDRLWVTDDPGAKFGDFAQTDVRGHLEVYNGTVRTFAAVSQISPNVLSGDLVNLSADALAQMEASTQRRIAEYETLFGEAWEQTFRLAALAAGDRTAAADTSAQVRWRDTEARSLLQTVQALGQMAQLLEVPVEALWEKIPGVTDTDVKLWKELRAEADPLAVIAAEAQRQAEPSAPAPAATPELEPVTPTEDASAVKSKADALGSLIRSGVDPESAAAKVGLAGVEFTGAVPVSLRMPEDDAAALEQA